MSSTPWILEDYAQDRRFHRARAALRAGEMQVKRTDDGFWKVASNGNEYSVCLQGESWACTCPDFSGRCQQLGLRCKHIEAVRYSLMTRIADADNESKYKTDGNVKKSLEGQSGTSLSVPSSPTQNGGIEMSYHTIVIVGHLGRDPEMRYTPGGQAVTNFNLAANHQRNDTQGQPVKQTIWFRVTAWGKTAENCRQYLKKGSLVLVEGRLNCDPETGGPRLFSHRDGSPGSTFEVNASVIRFLSGRELDSEPEETDESPTAVESDDLPF